MKKGKLTYLFAAFLLSVTSATLCACGDELFKDTKAPTVTVDMADTLVLGGSLEVTYTATDNIGVTERHVSVKDESGNDVTLTVYDGQTGTFTPTAVGDYYIVIEVKDKAGNLQRKAHTVTVTEKEEGTGGTQNPDTGTQNPGTGEEKDTQSPSLTLNMAGSLILGDSLEVKYTATDNVGVTRAQVTVKDGADRDVTSTLYDGQTKRFRPNTVGSFVISVQVWDEAGNTAQKSHTITVTEQSSPDYSLPSQPNFGAAVSVHDPSVFYDSATDRYYAFGSHFAVASSPDLVSWTQTAREGDAGKRMLFGTTNFRSVLAQSNKIVGGDQNIWAPHVIKLGSKYYMYYSLTSGFGSNLSVIGRVSSTNVTGPYSNEEIIVWSEGKAGNPNCIDPELFYDKEGKLWMVYGSFFSGIYIKSLNAETGLPTDGNVHSYGTLLWRGGATGVEGPDIVYHEATDYYYLVVSDGDLSTNYNMRVARSKNPNGPYTDVTGANMAYNYGKGNKLAGNYRFTAENTGYGAMGGGSLIEVNGECFAVFHTRYQSGFAHNVQVRQMFFNEDGWMLLSPNRYAKESLGKVTSSDVAGDYDVILHSTGNSQNYVSSSRYTLSKDGSVKSGASNVGSWSVSGEHFITLTVEGTAYKGVVSPTWSSYNGGVLCITATSSSGRSLWANGAPSADTSDIAVYQQVQGNATNRTVSAFDTSKGFAVSFYLSSPVPAGTPNDWNAVVISAGGTNISLPNIDAGSENVLYPSSNGANYNIGSSGWDCFLNAKCHVTVSVSTSGIAFYKNGARTQFYPASAKVGSLTLSDVIRSLLQAVQTGGFTFASGTVSAQDLTVSAAVSDAQAQALYGAYGK